MAAGPDGSLYIADVANHRLRNVSPDGTITTVAGGGVPAAPAPAAPPPAPVPPAARPEAPPPAPVPPAARPEAPPIRTLPRTGSGPGGLPLVPAWLPTAGAVGGLVALGAGVAVRRWRQQRPRPYER